MQLNKVREALSVERYHTKRMLRRETVGHHSAGAAMALLWLKPDASREAIIYMLQHDLGEVFTGDVPAPAKWESEDLTNELEFLEINALSSMSLEMPDLSEEELKLAKAADMLDLVLNSIEELRMGNEYAKETILAGVEYLNSMDLGVEINQRIDNLCREARHG